MYDRFKRELYDIYRGCLVHVKGAPTEDRGDGDPDVRVYRSGSRLDEALFSTPNGTPQLPL